MATREFVECQETGVVPRTFVLSAGVADAEDHLHGISFTGHERT
jgi:hypothetical protein